MWSFVADPTCMISSTGGQMVNIRDHKGQEVITEVIYQNYFIRLAHPDVIGRLVVGAVSATLLLIISYSG